MLYDRLAGSGNRRGIISMSLAIVLFVMNEAMCKLVAATIPTSQIMAVRGFMSMVLIFALVWGLGLIRQLTQAFERRVLMRATADLFGSYLYMFALFKMPIANMMAINMASPLLMTATVAIVLHETVGWRRWSAVVVGFVGVLLVVQPRAENFNYYSLFGIGAVCFLVMRDLVTRRIDPAISGWIITLTNAAMMTVATALLVVIEGWVPMGWYETGMLAVTAVFITAGYQLVVDAFRHAEVSVIVPLRYVGLLWALLLGFLIWGDVPNLLAAGGIVLIVASGLYVLHRERVRGLPSPPPAEPAP